MSRILPMAFWWKACSKWPLMSERDHVLQPWGTTLSALVTQTFFHVEQDVIAFEQKSQLVCLVPACFGSLFDVIDAMKILLLCDTTRCQTNSAATVWFLSNSRELLACQKLLRLHMHCVHTLQSRTAICSHCAHCRPINALHALQLLCVNWLFFFCMDFNQCSPSCDAMENHTQVKQFEELLKGYENNYENKCTHSNINPCKLSVVAT